MMVMSALCQKRTSGASFDHIVGATEQQRWHVEVHRLGGLEIDDQFKLCRRLDREVGRLLASPSGVSTTWRALPLFDLGMTTVLESGLKSLTVIWVRSE